MITGLYETHIQVKNLESSIAFYEQLNGLILAHKNEERRIAFFWIGKPKQQMLGLWESPSEMIEHRHFAFECLPDWVLNQSVDYLKSIGLKPYNFFNDGSELPLVFAWMPAIFIYFNDMDGNSLEFIGILEGKAMPEHGVIPYKQWLELQNTH